MATLTRLADNKVNVGWAAGTGSGPVAAAIYPTHNVSLDPEKYDVIAQQQVIGKYYMSRARAGGRWSELEFSTYLRGQNAVGYPPYEGALLRACGLYESATGASAGVYLFKYESGNPHIQSAVATTSTEAATDPVDIRVNYDNRDYLLANCVGNVVASFVAGQLPELQFKFMAQVATAATASAGGYTEADPTGSLVSGQNAVPVQSEGLQLLLTATTYTPTSVASIVLDFGNDVQKRPDINGDMGYGTPIIAGYNPKLTLVLEDDLIASYNPATHWVAGTQYTVTWTHNTGGTTGHVISGSFIGYLAEPAKSSKVNGRLMHTIILSQSDGSTLPYLQWS